MKRIVPIVVSLALGFSATQAHAKDWWSGCYAEKVYSAGFGASIPDPIVDKDEKTDQPVEHRHLRWKTAVFADIVVGPDGLVKCVHVHDTPFPADAEDAAKIAMTYKFKPALKNWKPVAVVLRVNISVPRYE